MIEAGVEAVGSWEVERRQWGGKHGSGWIWMILNADRLDYNILYSLSLSLSIYIYIYIYIYIKEGKFIVQIVQIYCIVFANLLHIRDTNKIVQIYCVVFALLLPTLYVDFINYVVTLTQFNILLWVTDSLCLEYCMSATIFEAPK